MQIRICGLSPAFAVKIDKLAFKPKVTTGTAGVFLPKEGQLIILNLFLLW